MGEHITEKAPAKLNLSLDVLGRLEAVSYTHLTLPTRDFV